MKVNIKPLADRVLVKPAEAEMKTAGGIIIPDTAKEKPQKGTVVAVGPGKKDEPMTLKVNDTVLYGKYSGTGYPGDPERVQHHAEHGLRHLFCTGLHPGNRHLRRSARATGAGERAQRNERCANCADYRRHLGYGIYGLR